MKRTLVLAMMLVLLLTSIQPDAWAQGPGGQPAEQIDDLTPLPTPAGGKVDNSDEHRIPEAYLEASGGPDPHGYTYTDSDGGGCTYDWIEIDTTTGVLPLAGDDGTAILPIGFPFPFYDRRYTQLVVDSNGALLLAGQASEWQNLPLGQEGPAPRVVPFWDDLSVESLRYQVQGTAPDRRLVLTYQARRSPEGKLRFQAVLAEDGRIVFQYHTLSGALSDGTSATVGIQGWDTGLGYLFNGYPQVNRLHGGLAVCFQPPLGAYLSPGFQRSYALARQEARYALSAINQTGSDGLFDFSLESRWPAAVTPRMAFMLPGEAIDLEVAVRVPVGAAGEGVATTVTMSSVGGGELAGKTVARLETVRASGDYGYTGASTSDEAAIFDLQTWTLVDRLSLLPEGDYPYDATMKPDGSEVWIPGAVGDGVVVIDTATNQISHRINVGEYSIGVAFRKDSAYAFVSNRDTEDVTVVDTSSYAVVDTIPTPTYYLGAGNLALNPCGGEIYVLDWYDDHFFVLEPETFTVTQEVALGDSLWQLVVNLRGDRLYITDRGQDVVHVLDTATLSEITAVPVGDDPWGIDITLDGSLVYVTNEDSHNVTAIDATNNTVITTIGLPHGSDSDPRDVDFSAYGAYAYVTSGSVTGNDEVYVIDTATHTVVGRIDVNPASNPNVVAVAPQMAGCPGLYAQKGAVPEPVVIGDPLTYTVSYLYGASTPAIGALVTDTLPAGVAYLTSTGGLTCTYNITDHQIIWELGTVLSGTTEELTALVLPIDEALAGQLITNEAYLDFANPGNFTTTVWALSTLVTPELAIHYLDGSEPPDPLPLCEGESVTLMADSNRSGPLAYAWDLGDGTVASTQVITHTWAYGDYTVLLTTTNAYGWVETDTLGIEMRREPAAEFVSNSPITLGMSAVFTDLSTYDPETWFWDFGDGVGTSDQPNPVYTYTQAGFYTVTLTVANYCGADIDSDAFEVTCQEPVADFVSNSPITLGMSAVFTDLSTYDPEEWFWDFGDGVGTSDQPNPVYTYTQAGFYTVTLTVTNDCGADIDSDTFEVTCHEPVAEFASNSPITLGMSALFTDLSTYDPEEWFWDFGDGVGTSGQPNPVYYYADSGVYTVTLTVSNACGTDVYTDLFEVREGVQFHYIYLPLVVRSEP